MSFYSMPLMALVSVVLLLPIALLPTIIALARRHPHTLFIALVNIFGGLFFGIGWLVALVWSCVTVSELATKKSVADELEHLNGLRERGIISDAEFETQKQQLLNPPR
ncbi:superinfection immunity protein [Halioxenophilus sp. WMMB6]|uniref:superinfection immunity protein n=1 Tax=Halioxenophilus sp. WMMB6 TaxID=3073815 RepID=UPI00295E7E57|nr:superinfection immunity protein [Halioxenophilus sp. WMMB6]